MNTQLRRTILIVEDSLEDRELYRRYLLSDRDCDYTIVEASLGEEGLNLWREHQPDAVLLDYRLPDMDGLEFLAALQTQQPLPIVMITGVGNEAIAVQSIKAGAQDYLVKEQITPESLQLALDAAIDAVQLRTQLQERIDRERVIAQISQKVSRSLNLDEILHTTVTEVRQFLQTDRVVVFQVEPDGNGRVVTESVGAQWRSLLSEQIYDPCFVESYVDLQRQGRVTVKADIYDGSIDPCHVQLLAGCQVRANLVVPILHDDRFWGVLIAHHCTAPRQWQPLEIDLLQQLSTQVSIAIRQAELYQQAQRELAERRCTEEVLRDQSEKLQLALEAARMATWDWDILTNRITWSPNMEALFGLAPGEFDGSYDRFVARLHPDDRDRVLEAINAAVTTGADYDIEFQVVYPNGTIRWALSQGKVFYDASGQPVRMAGIDLDISDRKQAELTLRASEERYKALIDITAQIVWNADTDGTVLNSNSWIFTGQSQEEYRGWGWMEAIHPDDCQRTSEVWLLAVANLTPYEIEHRLRRWDGEYRLMSARAVPLLNANGSVREWVGLHTDITEVRQAEDELRQAHALAQSQLMEIEAIYQTAPIGLTIIDIDLRFQRINQRLAEINGIAIAEHIGRTVREVVPDLADEAEPLLQRVLETGEPLLNLEISGETSAQPGIYRTWNENFYPLKDRTGRTIGINVVTQEITDRKRSAEVLQESEARFRQLAENIDAVFWLREEPESRVSYVSAAYERLWGWKPQELYESSSSWVDRIHPDDREWTYQAFESKAAAGQFDEEYRIVLDDGCLSILI
jgi:PAS domain S-box-containing protein